MLRINASLRAGFVLLNKRNSSSVLQRQKFCPSAIGGLSVRVRYMSGLTTYPLESLGDSITTAVLVTWQKNIGDVIKEDDVLAVVETDKVTMDIRSKNNGILKERLVDPGAEIAVGAPLYKLDVGTAVTTTSVATDTPAAPVSSTVATTEVPVSAAPSASHEVLVPIMGESITSGMLAKWSVKVGDVVKVDDVVAAIETDKVTVEVHSPYAGVISEIFSLEGAEVNVGQKLFIISSDPNLSSSVKTTSPPIVTPTAPVKEAVSPIATKPVAPAPPAATATKDAKPKPSSVPPSTTSPINVGGGGLSQRSETRVKMTRMRQRIAQRLKEAQNTAAMLTTFQELDMSALMNLRAKYKDDFEKTYGIKLGFMGAFVKASTSALLELPAVNAVIDDTTNEIVYHNYVDISVAVASPNGLVVPVLRDTQNMSISDIEKAISAYGKKAKDGALALEDMTGGTFTISNGGVFGSLFGTPIINPPQSAILGMHATKMRAVVVDGKVEARPMMYLALTYDHRLVDGREAVTFLKSVASKIEDPSRLVLGL